MLVQKDLWGGVLISKVSYLSHLLFVDDVLIFLNGPFRDTTCFKKIISLFCKVTCMEPNFNKSTIILVCCLQNEEIYALQQFDFIRQDLETRLKYLGFKLKPNRHPIVDWSWLIEKIKGRINIWQ